MAVSRRIRCLEILLILLAFITLYFDKNIPKSFEKCSIHNWSSSGSDTNGTSLKFRHTCIWKPARHIVFIPRGKGYYSLRVNYYFNSDCSFHLTRLIISADININPGPDKCSICNKSFARNHRVVDCDGCRGRYHFLCGGLTRRDLKAIQTGKRIWTCNKCILRELPLNTSFVSASSHSLNLSCSDDFVEANDITDSSLNDLTDVPEIVMMRHRQRQS